MLQEFTLQLKIHTPTQWYDYSIFWLTEKYVILCLFDGIQRKGSSASTEILFVDPKGMN